MQSPLTNLNHPVNSEETFDIQGRCLERVEFGLDQLAPSEFLRFLLTDPVPVWGSSAQFKRRTVPPTTVD